MRLPVIGSCLRCLYCDAERGLCCHRGPGPVRTVEADDGPPPEWCPLRTGPDSARLAALEAVARAAREVRDPFHGPVPMRTSLARLDAALAALAALDRKDGGE